MGGTLDLAFVPLPLFFFARENCFSTMRVHKSHQIQFDLYSDFPPSFLFLTRRSRKYRQIKDLPLYFLPPLLVSVFFPPHGRCLSFPPTNSPLPDELA